MMLGQKQNIQRYCASDVYIVATTEWIATNHLKFKLTAPRNEEEASRGCITVSIDISTDLHTR